MNRKQLIALSIVALLGSNAALAADTESVAWRAEGTQGYLRESGIDLRPAVSSAKRFVAHQERIAVGAEGDIGYLRESGVELRSLHSTLAREEVLADLEIWRESGLSALESGEAGPDVLSTEYRRAAAKYAALRSSPQFDERVEQIARQRGKPVIVVAR